MSKMSVNLVINSKICLRDPAQTDLGRSIIKESILMLDGIGLEQFTFKKLAAQIGSTEASIYRYFASKNQLFAYLINWYWEWLRFRIELQTVNTSDPMERMKIVIRIIVDSSRRSTETPYVDEDVLHRIVVREGIKAYHSVAVDEENREGYFLAYKSLCAKIADLMLEISPGFQYPRAFASNIIEMANNNIYFAKHLPRLTDIERNGEDISDKVVSMLEMMVFKMLQPAPVLAKQLHIGNGATVYA